MDKCKDCKHVHYMTFNNYEYCKLCLDVYRTECDDFEPVEPKQ